MSLTFPLSAATFADLLRISEVTFLPSYGQEYSGQGSGVFRAKDLRPMLWKLQITTAPLDVDTAEDFQAQLESLQGGINSFLMYNPKRKYPRSGNFDDSNVKIQSLSSNGKGLALKGLPNAFQLKRGDMLSFQYGGSSSYALHRVIENMTANSSGVTDEFEVAGGLRPGATTDTAVKLIKACGEFRLDPGDPFTTQMQDKLYTSFTFKATQKL